VPGAGATGDCPILHNHFSTPVAPSRCRGEMAASLHLQPCRPGRGFYEPKYLADREKIPRGVSRVHHTSFKSQARVFARQADWDKLRVCHCGYVRPLYTPRRHEAGP